MDSWNRSIEDITPPWRDILGYLPEEERCRVQEIRMRERAPLQLSLPDGLWYLRTDSRLTKNADDTLVMCDKRGVEDTFLRLCGYAIHAHEEEIRQGYVRAGNGCRCGIAGEMVVQDEQVRSFRRVTSLCLRIAREHTGCAGSLMERIFEDGHLHSLLLCGEPASGKTSLLRDLARQLSDPVKGKGLRVAVVDERGELAGLGTLHNCDILTGCPKPTGILQAVRALSPDVILFDELGSTAETEAIRQSLRCGVAVITSVHADGPGALRQRRAVRELLDDGAFDRIAFLQGRRNPCKVKQLYSCEEWYRALSGNGDSGSGRLCLRMPGRGTASPTGADAGKHRELDPVSADRVPVQGCAAVRGIEGVRPAGNLPGPLLSGGRRPNSGSADGVPDRRSDGEGESHGIDAGRSSAAETVV